MDHRTATQDYWDKFSVNRKKWEHVLQSLLNPVSTALIQHLQLKQTDHVLDVAAGTGEPGLTVASMLPNGFVTAIDVSEKMLSIASGAAREKGLGNYRTVCCEAALMPFGDHNFDAIVCRNGVMFFRSVSAGLKEMHRVLKPGGKLSVSTWGALDKNSWVSTVLDAITMVTRHKLYNRHMPGMFYCMQPGTMTDWFETASLEDIAEEEMTGIVEFRSFDEYWQYVTNVSASVVDALKNIPAGTQKVIREAVEARIAGHFIQEKLYFQWEMRITTGTKPA